MQIITNPPFLNTFVIFDEKTSPGRDILRKWEVNVMCTTAKDISTSINMTTEALKSIVFIITQRCKNRKPSP